tara:strand:+ start:2097 stop:2435 length:339 start_codon:yes stop_codon:yes gene_type:complete
MAITYKWTINALDAKISHDSKDNVINTIHWTYGASEGKSPNIYQANSVGAYSVKYDKDNFTEYASLKESDVIAWLEAGLDVASMKTGLDAQIALQKAPVDKTFRSPFAASVE